MATAINYAEQYSQALDQAYPFVLNFGALRNTSNNSVYKWIDSKTIQIPHITTTGRVDGDRDTIGTFTRNFNNSWESKTLTQHRTWETLIHPKDIDQTNMVTTITNITKVMNEEHKFPEMDAYLISKIYSDWETYGGVANETALSAANILSVFDTLMLAMDNERVPANGRILYVTHEIKTMLKSAEDIQRQIDVSSTNSSLNRQVNRLDEVEIIGVPASLMKSAYDFTVGYSVDDTADSINMFLVHPSAVITPTTYDFAQVDPPSSLSHGKYTYFEESMEDVFVLKYKVGAIQMNVTKYVAPTQSQSG